MHDVGQTIGLCRLSLVQETDYCAVTEPGSYCVTGTFFSALNREFY